MFFTLVEKQNSGILDGWTPRYVAFDTTRRYLYYSENIKNMKNHQLYCGSSKTSLLPDSSIVSHEGTSRNQSHSGWAGLHTESPTASSGSPHSNGIAASPNGTISPRQAPQRPSSTASPRPPPSAAHAQALPASPPRPPAAHYDPHISDSLDHLHRRVTDIYLDAPPQVASTSIFEPEDLLPAVAAPPPPLPPAGAGAGGDIVTEAFAGGPTTTTTRTPPPALLTQSPPITTTRPAQEVLRVHHEEASIQRVPHTGSRRRVSPQLTISPPVVTPRSRRSSAPTSPAPTSPGSAALRGIASAESAYASVQPTALMRGVKWKGKLKVTSLYIHAKNHIITTPQQLYQFDITGVPRDLASGESPSDYLLCPTTGIDNVPDMSPENRDKFFQDPYGLQELFESLRDQCIERKRQRELAIAKRRNENKNYKLTEDEKGPVYGTIRSPVKRTDFLSFNTEKMLCFRFACEYDYTRFLFVMLLVMGYDQMGPRPFKGFPPVDPRNGLTLAPMPAIALYRLYKLEHRMPYLYTFGNLIGRDSGGKLHISLKNCCLVITNELIIAVRMVGTIPTWLFQLSIQEFRYNSSCSRPYVAFLSDSGAPDFVFSPSTPDMGTFLPDVPFSPSLIVERIRHVMYQCCFASVQPRRVIRFQEAQETTIRSFVEAVEQERGPLDFRFITHRRARAVCPEDNVDLRAVWHDVGLANASMDHNVIENAAVPLYETHANDAPLSAEQMQMMRSLVEQQQLDEELVGLALGSVTSLAADISAGASMHGGALGASADTPSAIRAEEFIKSTHRRKHRGGRSLGAFGSNYAAHSQSNEAGQPWNGSRVGEDGEESSGCEDDEASSLDDEDNDDYIYGVPGGAHYLPRESS